MTDQTGDEYTFEVDGETFSLPSAETGAETLPGRFIRDAAMEGQEGQMRLGFALLEATGADPAAIDALYDLPGPQMIDHIQAWMEFKPSRGDASVGESSSSST